MSRPRAVAGVPVALLAVALVAAGCQQDSDSGSANGATTVTVTLTDDGCQPKPARVKAGPVTFKVTNDNASQVSEAELMRDDSVVGEKENLTPGLSGTFSLKLDAGKYQIYCPNAATERYDFTVTGKAADSAMDPAVRTALSEAVDDYHDYIVSEVDKLVPAAKTFTDAVRAEDIGKAQRSFASARYHYETVEPVAESFGDLDPEIDARINDVNDPSRWTGFHRLEFMFWRQVLSGSSVDTLKGHRRLADQLDDDIAKLKALVAKASYQPAQLANGATELLNEVASSKITGEEDRYSHTDLTDFQANLAGSRTAFELLKPALKMTDPPLTKQISAEYRTVQAALDKYAGHYSGTEFVDYSTVSPAERRALTQKVDALAEPLSQVAAKVTG